LNVDQSPEHCTLEKKVQNPFDVSLGLWSEWQQTESLRNFHRTELAEWRFAPLRSDVTLDLARVSRRRRVGEIISLHLAGALRQNLFQTLFLDEAIYDDSKRRFHMRPESFCPVQAEKLFLECDAGLHLGRVFGCGQRDMAQGGKPGSAFAR
jgi:hypothetical protein